MFKQKATGNPENVDTVVGINAVFEGNVECDGAIRVDGRFKGDLKASGDVFVGTDAVITGNVFANNIHLSGTVEGNIHATGVLRILATAKLFGDIHVHSFVADEGGVFQGKCSMIDVSNSEKPLGRLLAKKPQPGKDYKKSTVLDQVYEESEKSNELKNA